MSDSELYTDGARVLQDRFDTRRIADRLEKLDLVPEFSDPAREIIETAPMFFLATVDDRGRPDVSYKGGLPGFVRVTGPSALAFPDYNGNGMFKSLGALLDDPRVALIFIRWSDRPKKIRVHGKASIDFDDPLLGEFPGAQMIVRVAVERIFDNCPRYLHDIEFKSYSRYIPRENKKAPIPDWKRNPDYRDALPKRDLEELAKDERR
jgi:predicted pyridoxine 5'-phosphate oxidase superfamily flavin-nucleotide-binding protein